MIPLSQVARRVLPSEVLDYFFSVGDQIGLVVTAWQDGEPVLAVLDTLANILANAWNETFRPFILVELLDFAEGPFLTLVARQLYGVERDPPGFAVGPITLTNNQSLPYVINSEQYSVRNANTKKTYKIISSGETLAGWPGTGPKPTLTLMVLADETGTTSNAIAGEVTEVVSGLAGVSVTNAGAIIGTDSESDESLRARARLEPWGKDTKYAPKRSRKSIAVSTYRTDGTRVPVNRAEAIGPLGDGLLVYYVAYPSGAVSGPDVTLIQTRMRREADSENALTTVLSVDELDIAFTANVYLDRSFGAAPDSLLPSINAKLTTWSAQLPIGGSKKTATQFPGYVYQQDLESTIKSANDKIVRVESDWSDTSVQPSEVGKLGAFTINLFADARGIGT